MCGRTKFMSRRFVNAGEFLERINALLCEHKDCIIDRVYVEGCTLYIDLSDPINVTDSVSMSERYHYRAGMSLIDIN